jgi:hypothetical protein
MFHSRQVFLRRWFSQVVVFIFIILGMHTPSHAQLWQGAPPQTARTWTVGGFGEFYFNPNDFMALGQLVYGLTGDIQLEGRLGLGTLDPYLGLFGKFALLKRKVLDISIFSGFHHQTIYSLDFSLVLSHSYSRFQIYIAPYFQVPLENGPPIAISMIPGVNIQINKRTRFYTEVNLNMSDSRASASAGVRYLF